MFATTFSAANAYGRVGTQSAVESADPHRLVLMLFDGALEAISRARAHLAAGRVGPRGEAISQAIRIVDMGLKASLDKSAGGVLAESLGELYDYIGRQLLMASITSNAEMLDEAGALLGGLRDAWSRIRGAQPGDGTP